MHSGNSNGRKPVENVLFRNLKSRIRHSVGEEIQQELTKQQNENPHLPPEDIIQNIFQNVSDGDAFNLTRNAFVEDVDYILKRSNCQGLESTIFDDNLVTHSLSGSFSSLNSSSIDFLSFEQLANLFQILAHSSPLEQLEALETLCRLSTLEHITKQSVWPNIYNTLLELMLYSDVNFVKEGCIRVFVKMLSSHELKVVNEGFHGLVDFFSKYLEAESNVSLLKNEFVGRVFVLINRFQREVPSHWLRYPHKITEDIVKCSVNLLESNQTSESINFFAHFDIQAVWLKNYMYGNISRSLLFNAFQEKSHIFNNIIKECDRFHLNEAFDFGKCCKDSYVATVIHNICFLSHFLKYSYGRNLLEGVYTSDNTWIDIFSIVILCSWKIIQETCNSCSMPILENVPDIFKNLWNNNDAKGANVTEKLLRVMMTPLTASLDSQLSCMFSLCFCEILQHPPAVSHLVDVQIEDTKFLVLVIQKSLMTISSLKLDCSNRLHILTCNLCLIQRVLLIPNIVLANLTIVQCMISCQKVFSELISKLSCFMTSDFLNPEEYDQYNICLQQAVQTYFIFLQKPVGLIACMESNTLNEILSLLSEGLKIILEFSKAQCTHYFTTFSYALSYNFNILFTSEHVAKLSDIIWNGYSDINHCLEKKSEDVLKNLVLAILSKDNVINLYFSESTSNVPAQLIKCILLYPTAKNEYISHEHTALMLRILSLLIYDVHVVCVLRQQFQIQKLLIEMLYEYILSDGSFLIDEVSILLNYCIVKLYSISGPTECNLPPKRLDNIEQNYVWPLTVTYPLSPVYFRPYKTEVHEKEEISLTDFKLHEQTNLHEFQQHLVKHFKTGDVLPFDSISDILLTSLNYISVSSELSYSLGDNICKKKEIASEDIIAGICLTLRYGGLLQVLPNESDTENDVTVLLQKCSKLRTCKHQKFDVFVLTVFLLFKGNLSESLLFLETFLQSPNSLFIWNQRGIQYFESKGYSSHFNRALLLEFCNCVIKDCLPMVFSSFQLCDSLPSVMFDYWMSQCFWNYLDLQEIGNFIILIVLFGTEYAIYYFAAILKYFKIKIFHQSQLYNLISHLKESSLSGYKLSSHIEYIISLAAKYNTLSKDFFQHLKCIQ